VTDPVGRTFRAFADQTRSDHRALAACLRGSRRLMTRDEAAGIKVPVLIAVVEATVLARVMGAPSIYSARLRARPRDPDAGAGGQPAPGAGPTVAVPLQQRRVP